MAASLKKERAENADINMKPWKSTGKDMMGMCRANAPSPPLVNAQNIVINMSEMYKHQTQRRDPNRNPDWKRKLAAGEAFEGRVINWLKKEGHEAFKPIDNTYDLHINIRVPLYGALHLTGECKWDIMAEHTRNLAVQTFDNGKPSGIHPDGPNPELWFHGVGKEMWVARTRLIQNLVEMHRTSWGGQTVPMGNKSEGAQGVLIPISVAKKAIGTDWVTL